MSRMVATGRYYYCPICGSENLDPLPVTDSPTHLPAFLAGLFFGCVAMGLLWFALGFVWYR